MTYNIIETHNISKTYHLKGHKRFINALDNISFNVREGEIFGLLGPNGAGKTTIVSLLTTLLNPTSGYALIDGFNIIKDVPQVRSRIGLILGGKMNYNRITGYANLKFFCKIYQVPNYNEKINHIAEEFNLKKWLHEYVERYSSGMKIKLSLCRILLINPKIIFLDEPTIGLDVQTTEFVIKKLKEIKRTIFLTSHNMNVVERLCNRIAFLNNGKIERIGDKDDIKKISSKRIDIIVEIINHREKLKAELRKFPFIVEISDVDKELIITLSSRNQLNSLLEILAKYPILTIKEDIPSLEKIFLEEFKN